MPSLTTHYTNDIRSAKTAGGDGAVNQFNFSEPSEMKLRLLLDDTTYANAVAYLMPSNTIPDGVDAIVEKLLTMCHAIDGKTHQPYFIRVTPMQMPLVKGRTADSVVSSQVWRSEMKLWIPLGAG